MRLGQWEKALSETEEVGRLDPTSATFNSNMVQIELALNHTEDARRAIQQALARKLDSVSLRLSIYGTAFVRGDQETMQEQLAWAAGRPREEDWLFSAQSDTEAYFGRLAKAREFSRQAVESALRAGAQETAALWQVNAALREAEFGDPSSARRDALAALTRAPGRDVKSVAALALARAGDGAQAQKLSEILNKDFPQDTIVQGYWLPSIRTAIELGKKNSASALEILQTAAPYESGQCEPFQVGMLYPIYLRGQAYLAAHQGKEAVGEFQKIIDHDGIVLNFPLGALARLGLARAYASLGDTAKTRAAYQEFLVLWKEADPDIPILKEANAEYTKLR
jgi:predicted Zn-dependent protease